jgi:organic hydroperoxide reductase OsmC/OhrA
MAKTATYSTDVSWRGDHWGHLTMGNGPQMIFSAPPDAYGQPGVLTPEDAFVAAANTCVMMMFLWACERFKIDLLDYQCHTEGTKKIELDRTEIFTQLRFYPQITVKVDPDGDEGSTKRRVRKALAAAQKYSLVANSVKSEIIIEPTITIKERNEHVEPTVAD